MRYFKIEIGFGTTSDKQPKRELPKVTATGAIGLAVFLMIGVLVINAMGVR